MQLPPGPGLVIIHVLKTVRLDCVLRVPQFRSQSHIMTETIGEIEIQRKEIRRTNWKSSKKTERLREVEKQAAYSGINDH